jgi:hypothetical protein
MKGFSVFEAMAEELLEGKLARLLGGRLQPVDIANALARAVEDGQTRDSEGRDFAPNHYVVQVNADDFRELGPFLDTLQEQFSTYVAKLAAAMQLSITGCARVMIEPCPSVPAARTRVEARIDVSCAPSNPAPEATRPMRLAPDSPPRRR